jgi:hypothetical protein
MEIEYVGTLDVAKEALAVAAYGEEPIPIVRLVAVDQVIAEAVWAMVQFLNTLECLALVTLKTKAERDAHFSTSPHYQHAKAFLASDTVAQWRKRQESAQPKSQDAQGWEGIK